MIAKSIPAGSDPRESVRILLASELGGNLGHVGPLAAIARALVAKGLEPILAVPDVAAAQIVSAACPVIPSPRWEGSSHDGASFGSEGYLDVLVVSGFSDPYMLRGLLSAWQSILNLIAPSVIVADHAPALVYLAEAAGLPVVHVGTGFTLPPILGTEFASLRPARAPLIPESRLRAGLGEALSTLGYEGPKSLTSAFARGSRVVCSLRELDPYGASRSEPGLLPVEDMPRLVEPPGEPRLFAYLDGATPGVFELVNTLVGLGWPLATYIRSCPAALNEFIRLRGHEALSEPGPLAELLPRCSHVMSHGGSTMAHAALCAGRPHLVWPLHDEAWLNLDLLGRLGAAVELKPDRNATTKGALLRQLHDHSLVENALRCAAVIAARNPQGALDIALPSIVAASGSA